MSLAPDPALQKRAAVIFMLAKRRGMIAAPPECSACMRRTKPIIGHHESYLRPLDVIWLCTRCHMKRHAELGWGLPHSRKAAA